MAAILKFSVRPSATAIFTAFFPQEYLLKILNQRKVDHPGHLVKKKAGKQSGKVNLDMSVLKHYLAYQIWIQCCAGKKPKGIDVTIKRAKEDIEKTLPLQHYWILLHTVPSLHLLHLP